MTKTELLRRLRRSLPPTADYKVTLIRDTALPERYSVGDLPNEVRVRRHLRLEVDFATEHPAQVAADIQAAFEAGSTRSPSEQNKQTLPEPIDGLGI